MTIKMYYDQAFKSQHGNSQTQSVNAMRRVMNHVQNFFLWSSLTTKIFLTVKAHQEVPTTFESLASDNSM
jgi:hypothetical protein